MSGEKQKADHELVRAFQGGNPKTFDELVRRHQDRVFNLCYRMMGTHEDADDCAQETFVRVYRSLKTFRFRSAFSTWLYRIAVNTCKNRLASKGYRRDREMARINGSAGAEHAASMEIGDCTYTPNGALERKATEELLQRAIDSLPEDQRMVIVLRDVEDLPYEEIARITGLHLGTVKSKIARGRSRLRDILGRLL
jgi:RNA polymerase sigma-70 factor (ECF subfamily)